VLVRGLPGFNSIGHAVLVAVYVAINCAILFTNVQDDTGHIANRFGWYGYRVHSKLAWGLTN
jgi:hypothetical protein